MPTGDGVVIGMMQIERNFIPFFIGEGVVFFKVRRYGGSFDSLKSLGNCPESLLEGGLLGFVRLWLKGKLNIQMRPSFV